jgi:hypothetical protein
MREFLPLPGSFCAGTQDRPVEGINMGACGTCNRNPLRPAAPATLFGIRHGYRAEWKGLAFSVETDSSDWTLSIQDYAKRETLYTARRAQAPAAQLVAAEFAVFRVLGHDSLVSPDRLAKELNWQEYW